MPVAEAAVVHQVDREEPSGLLVLGVLADDEAVRHHQHLLAVVDERTRPVVDLRRVLAVRTLHDRGREPAAKRLDGDVAAAVGKRRDVDGDFLDLALFVPDAEARLGLVHVVVEASQHLGLAARRICRGDLRELDGDVRGEDEFAPGVGVAEARALGEDRRNAGLVLVVAVVALEVNVPAPREALPRDFFERERNEILHRLADVARLARPSAVPVAVLVVVVRAVAVGGGEEVVVLRILGGLEADFDRVARAHLGGLVSRLLVVHELRVLAVVAIGDIEVVVVAREPGARLAVGLLEVIEERRRLGGVANPLFKLDRGLDAGGELLKDGRLRARALFLVDETRNVHVARTVLGRL